MKFNYYHSILVIVTVGIFYSNVPLYSFETQGFTLLEAPKHWVLLFSLLALPILLRHMDVLAALMKNPVAIWCLGHAWVAVLWFLLSSQSDTAWQEVRNRFFAIIEIFTFLVIFWEPGAIRLARKTLVGCVLFAVALNIYEVFVPMSFSDLPGRSAGLYINPTLAGEALVLGMILSVTVLGPRYRGPFVLVTGIGILTTFSRGGILTWVIAVAGLMLLRGISLKNILLPCVLGIVFGILIVLPRLDQILTTWERTGVLNTNVLERLEWLSDPTGVSDRSSSERKYLAQQAWDKIAERPVLGSGTGSSYEATIPPHNQYLAFMLDHGLIGVMILPLLILAVVWHARGEMRHEAILFACVFLLLSLFSNTMLGTQYNLLAISLMAAMAAMSRHQESQRTITMKRKGSATERGLASA